MSDLLPKQLQTFEYYAKKLPLYLRKEPFLRHFRQWFALLVLETVKVEPVLDENEYIDSSLRYPTIYDEASAGDILDEPIELPLANFNRQPTVGEQFQLTFYTEENETYSTIRMRVIETGLISRFAGLLNCADRILQVFDVFSDNYLDNTGLTSQLLERIAALFNLRRKFSVSYKHNGQDITSVLDLTDDELLLLIRCTIIKNYYNGTTQQIQQYYDKAGLIIKYTASNNASVNVYLLILGDKIYSDNIKAMFFAKMLVVESLGIAYNYEVTDPTNLAIWDVSKWDGGTSLWAI